MDIPTPVFIMAGLCALSGFFWWQESRKADETLSLRGQIHRRLTFLFAALAVFQYFVFR